MNLKFESTIRLRELLRDVVRPEDIEAFISKHCYNDDISFSDYYTDYIFSKDLPVPEIIERSGVSKNYIYNIINGHRKPARDKIIALCVGAGMNFTETNRALEVAGEGCLYPKNERDARIIIAINKRFKRVEDINAILIEKGLDPIE